MSVGAADQVAVELCAGLGGLGIGLRALGYRIAKAYDSWEQAVAVYNHNFGGDVATTANLLSEKGRRLVEADSLRIGDVDDALAVFDKLPEKDRGGLTDTADMVRRFRDGGGQGPYPLDDPKRPADSPKPWWQFW